MLITTNLIPVRTLLPTLNEHVGRAFAQTNQQLPYLSNSIESAVKDFLKAMTPGLWVNVESPYIDKVYRDSYYQYYATKLVSFSKDCIRLSFFDAEISETLFLHPSPENRQQLQAHYVGFLVIRPTAQNPIGRNTLSPRAFKRKPKTQVLVCQTTIPTTINGVKLVAIGFPHSAQDVETFTCSQTTLWAVMEYFSHRYAEYSPVLPSTIVQQLAGLLVERNLPAPGLSVEQVSFALKQNGFAPRIYLRTDYDEEPVGNAPQQTRLRKEFDALLSCYVESGIPVIVAIEDEQENGHAMVCIGYETPEESIWLDKYLHFDQLAGAKVPMGVFDIDQYPRRFVFIDDNHPPYITAELASPTQHYKATTRERRAGFDWKKGRITAFVVPLHRKVYLEAFEAKRQIKRFLALNLLELDDDLAKQICLRIFLTSSRSYKDTLLNDPLLPDIIKEFIIQAAMPKLIWVGELTNPVLQQKNQVFGVVLLDATEADTTDQNAPIFAVSPQIIANFADPNPETQFLPTDGRVGPFSRYMHNLN